MAALHQTSVEVKRFVAPPSHACFQVYFLTAPCFFDWSRMPVQYVIEEWEFRDLTLKMRPPVFIPRPETEVLCTGHIENPVINWNLTVFNGFRNWWNWC